MLNVELWSQVIDHQSSVIDISGISRLTTRKRYNSSSIANLNGTVDTLASRPDIPQEIIDAIIDELHGNAEALKSCAMVSRTFYLPSRSKFFSSIELDTIDNGDRLHELLVSNPDIPPLIHKFSITINLGIRCNLSFAEERIDQIKEWYRSNPSLPAIFNALSDLQWLSWGKTRGIHLA
jgi:hypothetical protein